MREVEERARAAGGRVWRLIRDRSRQQGNDGGGSEEDEGSSDGDSDEGSRPTQENGGHGVGTSSMPPAVPSRPRDGSGRPAAVQPPEWVQARLDLMLHRGSFIDGDELGQQRNAAGSVSSAQVASGGGGEGVSAESAAESFASLAQKAVGDAVGGERGEADRGLSALQADMYAHAAALSRLAGWMAQAVPATGGGGGDSASQIALTPTSRRPSTSGGARGTSLSSEASSPSALAIFSPSAVAGFNPEPSDEAAQVESGPHATAAAAMGADRLASKKTILSGSSGDGRANSVMAAMRLARELDDLEASVKRERFTAHRAAEEEIYRIPELYKEACALGNALILRGHDYLSQVRMVPSRPCPPLQFPPSPICVWWWCFFLHFFFCCGDFSKRGERTWSMIGAGTSSLHLTSCFVVMCCMRAGGGGGLDTTGVASLDQKDFTFLL